MSGDNCPNCSGFKDCKKMWVCGPKSWISDSGSAKAICGTPASCAIWKSCGTGCPGYWYRCCGYVESRRLINVAIESKSFILESEKDISVFYDLYGNLNELNNKFMQYFSDDIQYCIHERCYTNKNKLVDIFKSLWNENGKYKSIEISKIKIIQQKDDYFKVSIHILSKTTFGCKILEEQMVEIHLNNLGAIQLYDITYSTQREINPSVCKNDIDE